MTITLLYAFLIVNFTYYLYVNLSEDKIQLFSHKTELIIITYPVDRLSKLWVTNFLIVTVLTYTAVYWLFIKNTASSYYIYRFNAESGFIGRNKLLTYIFLYFRVALRQTLNIVYIVSIIIITFTPFYLLEEYFHGKNQYLFDFLENVENLKSITALNGNYASFVLAVILSGSFFIYIARDISSKYFIASVILFAGFWISFSSVFNGIYSYQSSVSVDKWYEKENDSSLLTLRISSILILFDLLKFLFVETFGLSIMINSEGVKFKRREKSLSGVGHFSYMDYSTVYFAQIGFYVLTMLILWHFMKISYHSIVASLLNWALFFVIDDWAIIYNYSRKFKSLSLSDSRKIELFNLAIIILSLVSMYQSKSWVYIILYVFIALVLAEQKYNNAYLLNTYE